MLVVHASLLKPCSSRGLSQAGHGISYLAVWSSGRLALTPEKDSCLRVARGGCVGFPWYPERCFCPVDLLRVEDGTATVVELTIGAD